MDQKTNGELAVFQKKAVELLAGKFIADYRRLRKMDKGVEIENTFEVWAKHTIRELALRDLVWHDVMLKLRGKK